jgi:hypothetical protein
VEEKALLLTRMQWNRLLVFLSGAIVVLVPGSYGVWQAATQAGSVMKGVTYTCRKVTGDF